MKLHNAITNTTPLIAHAQGKSSQAQSWIELIELAKHQPINGLPPEITIVTFAANRERAVLVEQLSAANVSYLNAARAHRTYWRNVYKIKYLADALREITTPYVLALDARDVLLAEDQSQLLDRFQTLNCSMLYGATVNRFPHPMTADVESGIETPWKYLNAGTMLAETEFAKEFCACLLAHELDVEFAEFADSEQARVRSNWAAFRPRIRADYACHIFQTLSGASYSVAENLITIAGIAPPDPAEIARKQAAAIRVRLGEWWAQLPRAEIPSEGRAALRLAKAAVLDALSDHDIDDVRAVIAATPIPEQLEALRAEALAAITPEHEAAEP